MDSGKSKRNWACTGAERESQFKAVKPISTTPIQQWPISDTEGDRHFSLFRGMMVTSQVPIGCM
jgi:hypothetical protein